MLVINRVPPNSIKRFKELASDNEYCKDYGMLLRDLIKEHDSMMGLSIEEINAKVEILAKEFISLKERLDDSQRHKELRMANGRTVRIGGDKNGK